MNLRKFYFIVSTVVSVFLFLSGALMILQINSLNETGFLQGASSDFVSGFLKPFILGKDPVNFIVLVGDKSEANTDTMMLVNFNPAENKFSILSLPRDTKVNVSGKTAKINSLYARKDGAKLLIDTISNLLDVKIKYYVYFNISTFRDIIDLLGGVEYNIPANMDYDDPTQNLHIHLKKGKQRLDGKKAEQFLRFRQPNPGAWSEELRKHYDGSDLKRIEAQQNFLKELFRQKANILYLPKLNEVVNVIYENLETNITLNEVARLIKSASNFNPENVKMFTLPGTSVKEDYWYYIYDKSKGDEIIKENFYADGQFISSPKTSSSEKSEEKTNKNANTQHNNSSNKDTTGKKETSFTKNNPSNSDTSIVGTPQPEP
jgi:LCP family protein required for cell wall assembly